MGSDTSNISINLNSHSDPADSRCYMIAAGQKHLNFSKQKSLGKGIFFKLGEDKERHESKLWLLEW